MSKYFRIGIVLVLLMVSIFIYMNIKEKKRYEYDQQAIEANRKVEEVIYKETIDSFTIYFYQPQEQPIVVDYVYHAVDGVKRPTKKIALKASTEHQVIWHFEEKNGSHLIVVSQCLFDPTPFTISDSLNSTFKPITFTYEGFDYTYYVSTFDVVDDYQIYINQQEITNWEK